MTEREGAIQARWRRLSDAVEGVGEAISTEGTAARVPDAVAFALDAVYDLAEALKQTGRYSNRGLEDLADGDADGETTFGLVWPRSEDARIG